MIMCFIGTACSKEQSEQEAKENTSSYKPEGNYLECAFNEEYLASAYGETYEYTKPFDNVYVHFEIIP